LNLYGLQYNHSIEIFHYSLRAVGISEPEARTPLRRDARACFMADSVVKSDSMQNDN